MSTDQEEQLLSYENQVNYYTNYISENPLYEYAGTYADEGISGTNTKKRDEFNRMIADCRAGKIDMIITKSISRFARNTLDCLNYVRELKDLGIGIIFEKENINTLDAKGEVLHGFKGKGCIGILIKNGLPAEEIEILSKDVEIDGEIYTLSSNIKYKTNCITETSTSISVDEDGEIDTNTSWSERFKSKASLSIHGIEVPYNLFPDYSNGMSKAVLKIPFPFSFRLDIGVNSDLNLNSARDQIIYDEKWLTFEENLYRIICRRLKDTLSSSDWKILNEIIQKNNTDTFSRVANSFE